jgi:hypothetical protein
MTIPNEPSPTKLIQLLTEMNLEGDFPMAVLAIVMGFPSPRSLATSKTPKNNPRSSRWCSAR